MSNEAFEKWFENTVLNDNIHDVAEWAWQAAKAGSEQEIAELKAHINDLREVLKQILFYSEIDWIQDNIEQILEKTPAQSLQEHDNEVIENCAIVCESSDRHRGEYFAAKICALKGK